jgi:hypothetical protein
MNDVQRRGGGIPLANKSKLGIYLLMLLFALATQIRPLFAQVKSSAITGTVTDKSGAVLPNATITAVEQDTNVTTSAQSDSKGEYSVPYLPIGHYTITVTAPGFTTYRKTDIPLASATTVRADVPMAVGNATISVDVKADALALQTENATVSDAVTPATIEALPNINNNSLYFATLESGVVGTPQQLGSSALGVGYADRRDMSAMRINGGELGSNDVQLDGTTIQGAAWHETAVLPNPDALSEVRVTTNNFTADIGMAQGVVSQTTRAGTNKYHGDLNYMFRNEDLNANSFSNGFQHVVRPKYRLQQGGGSIGGPVIIPKLYNGKDKLFFFGSFLRLSHTVSNQLLATVPTLAERAGDFSQTVVTGANGAATPLIVYNPFTATPYNGSTTTFVRQAYANSIVTNTTPAGLALLNGYPNPNSGTFNGIANNGDNAYHLNNYRYTGIVPESRNSFNGRIDYKLRSSQSIYVTGGISKGSLINPNYWGNNAHGNWVNQNGGNGVVLDSNPYGALGYTIVLNPTTVLDMHYGVTHINTQAQVNTASGNPLSVGQPAFVSATAPFGPNVLPELSAFGPYSALNNNSYGNKKEHQLNHTVNGSLTKVLGTSTLKFGAEYRVYLQNWQDVQLQSPTLSTTNYTGQYGTLAGAATNIPDPQDAGNIAASIVSGVEGWSMAAPTVPVLALASKYTAMYAQDSWRPTQKWLITAGIRYEVQPGPTERYNRMSSYDLNAVNPFAASATPNAAGNLGFLTFPGVDGHSRNLYATNWNNVSPRMGVTYQATENTVIRGGFGRSYIPSNTGFNANGTIYGPTAFAPAVNPIPYGLTPNGLPAGTFDLPTNTYVVQAAGSTQSPNNYGTTGGVDIFNRTLYKTGHNDQYNIFVERQLTSTWLVNAGYVGSNSGDLPWRQFPLNGNWAVPTGQLATFRNAWIASNGVTDPATANVANPLPALIGHAAGPSGGATITAIQSYMPHLMALTQTNYESRGSSSYNALLLKVQHSTSHGLMLGANYTWSKTTGIVGTANNQTYEENQEGNSSGPTGGVDYANLRNNHSLTTFDIPNRFVLNGSYALPFGKGKLFGSNAVVNEFIGGWQVSTAITLQSGNPFGPTCSGTLNGRCNRVPEEPLQVATKDQHYYNGIQTLTLPDGRVITPAANTFVKWNPDAWSQPTQVFTNGTKVTAVADQYQNGSTPLAIGYLRTPGVENVNISVIKRFPITEGVDFVLHVNATNALNHTNHEVVNNSVNSYTTIGGGNNASPGQNGNVSFGSYGLTTLEARQLIVQANINF